MKKINNELIILIVLCLLAVVFGFAYILGLTEDKEILMFILGALIGVLNVNIKGE